MGLNIGGSGAAKNFIKFNAKSDKWFRRGDEGEIEMPRPTFVADFENIATGFLRFKEGQAPERVIDPSLNQAAPSPGEGFKRGFVLAVYSPKFFGGLAELSSNGIHLSNAIKDLYRQFEEQRAAHAGQLPVVACTGSEAMKDKYGTNYRPKLEIVKWVERPAEMPNQSPVDAADVWRGGSAVTPAAQPKPQAAHVPPPASKPANPLEEAVF
jgi:hypothetical protein